MISIIFLILVLVLCYFIIKLAEADDIMNMVIKTTDQPAKNPDKIKEKVPNLPMAPVRKTKKK